MQEKRFRLLLIWNTALTVLFLISLGANAMLVRAAGDPPVRVFSAETADGDIGGDLSGKLVLDSTRPKRLLPIQLNLSAEHEHYCVAVASLEIRQPQSPGRYQVFIDYETGTFPYTSIRELNFQERTLQNQTEVREVTTVFTRKMKPGNHTLSLVGGKRDDAMPDLPIQKAAMFAICMQPNVITP